MKDGHLLEQSGVTIFSPISYTEIGKQCKKVYVLLAC